MHTGQPANDNRVPFWDATAISIAVFFATALPGMAALVVACFAKLGWL